MASKLTAQERYSGIAMALHWTIAMLIAVMFGIGWYMVDLPQHSHERSFYFALHKSIGLTIMLLVIFRLVWRFRHHPPALPQSLLAWQRRVANASHLLLYVFMIVQPVSGYLSSSFSGYSTKFWGVPLPEWGWHDAVINEFFTDVHVASSVALLCLIAMHICGALAHLAGVHENVLVRMLPSPRRQGSATGG